MPNEVPSSKQDDFVSANKPLLSFMKRCGESIRGVLGGNVDPREVIFPAGNSDMVESVYQDTPQSRYYNSIMAKSLKALVNSLPMDRVISVLEIGAGTGGTSSALLPMLPEGRTRYVYTDISPLFTAKGKERFGSYPFIEYKTLNISKDPLAQGFNADEFDIVVCSNILHATVDLTATMKNITKVLAQNGVLFLREITLERPAMGFEISFGCLLGNIEDHDLRGNNPFLTTDAWQKLLGATGFDKIACFPDPAETYFDEHVIMARYSGVGREAFSTQLAQEPAVVTAITGTETGHALLGRRLSSPLAVAQFTSEVSANLQPFLAQHQVFDLVVVPGTAHFDLAAAAGMQYFSAEKIQLENVVLREALILDSGARNVQVLVTPSDTGADFEIFSQSADQGQSEWHMHVSGHVAPLYAHLSAGKTNVEKLRQDGSEVDVKTFYETFDSYGAVHYGPIFRGLRRLWKVDGGAVAEVVLDGSESGKDSGFIVHPALLDSCLQSMVAALASSEEEVTGDGFMPFSVEKIIFHKQAPETVWCHAVMKEGDSFKQDVFSASFSIFTPDGDLVCEIINLNMRKTNKETLELLKAGQQQHTDLCYDMVWRQTLMPEKQDLSGNWLIFAGNDDEFAHVIADKIADAGGSADFVYSVAGKYPEGSRAILDENPEDFVAVIQGWQAKGNASGVIFLWGLDCYVLDFVGENGNAYFKTHTAQSFLHLAQALAKCDVQSGTRLATVTCQAQGIRESDQPLPTQSLLWGLEKSVANELGAVSPIIIDLDPVTDLKVQASTLCSLIGAKEYREDKVAVRGNVLQAPRLVRSGHTPKVVQRPSLSRPESEAYKLDFSGTGIENIRAVPMQRRELGAGEIEIEAQAYGLNFNNIIVAMGLVEKINTFILDCSGIVTRVGEGVTRFVAGDRVFTTVYGDFASHVYAKESFTAKMPDNLAFEDAAKIPTVFMTSWHALVEVAKLQKGETVLLHSATGGVGLAAIQVAKACGATIIATAGTERKRALLRSMGIEHVFSSRTTDFEAKILAVTEGQGVHVVLNFLTKELADCSMRCLAQGGRFIEIGKTDLRTAEQVAAIRNDITYDIVDLEELGKRDEQKMQDIFINVMQGFADGVYTPIAHRIFTMDAITEAFRYMLEGRHIGKVIVRNTFAPKEAGIRPDASYAITGGMSEVGLALAAHLADRGAKHVWLLGRSPVQVGSVTEAAVAVIAATGCQIQTVQLDVTDRAALVGFFEKNILPASVPLKGVFHLAGLLEDDVLTNLTWTHFNNVLSPKVDGSWFLHELTRDIPLDHFVVFSSIASVFGTHGQANHVAANTFMDALIAMRRADFLPGLTVNWGAWGEIGTVVRMGILDRIRKQGVEGFDTATGLAILDRLMNTGEQSKIVTSMEWGRMLPILQATAGAVMYDELKKKTTSATGKQITKNSGQNSNLGTELRNLSMSKRVDKLRGYLKKEIAGFLRLNEEAIPDDAILTSLGMDSLISLDLFQRISRDLNIRIAPHEMSAKPTVIAMAEKFANDLGPAIADDDVMEEVKNVADLPLSQLLEIAPKHAYEPFPLSDMQQAYWIGRGQSGMPLGGVSCHFYFEADAQGLDLERYEQAWNVLIKRQPMLRTIILDSENQQVLEDVPPFVIPRYDLKQSTTEEIDAHVANMRERMSPEVLAVDTWPNFRIEISELSDKLNRMHFSFDLILCDFHGISQMLAELTQIYGGKESELPKLEISFRDYRLAEERYRATKAYAKDRQYWMNRLDDLPSAPKLPLAVNPATLMHPEFGRKMTHVDAQTWARIKKQGEVRGLAPTAVALAVFAEVLGRWSEDNQFCLNLTLFNRLPMHKQVNDLVGEFTSNSLLAVDLDQGHSFEIRAGQLWSQLWDDMTHRSFSGIRVLRELSRKRGGAAGIIPVIFTSTLSIESSNNAFALGELGNEVFSVSQTPQVWLDHQLFEVDGELRLVFDFVQGLFPEGMIDAMFQAYESALRNLADDEENWGTDILVMPPVEQLQKRAEVNDTALDLSAGLMYEPFLQMAKQYPAKNAVIAEDKTLSYEELEHLSRVLALELISNGVQLGDRVGVYLPKGWEQVVAVLGIQRAGAAYLPLDCNQPIARIEDILADAGASAVVGTSSLSLDIPKVYFAAVDMLNGEAEVPALPEIAVPAEQLAYIIYTSGSTGKPKGVMISHEAAMNTILDVNRRYAVTEQDSIFCLAKLSFDLSVYDIFGLLAVGGTIVMPNDTQSMQPQRWLELMREHKVTLWNSVPAFGQLLADTLEEDQGHALALRLAIFSGDWIPQSLTPRLQAAIPNITIMAMGGATEASIWSNFHEVVPEDAEKASVPYGKPLANQGFAVLDAHLSPLPDGVAGDLYITGKGLSLGYWNDAEKTDASFLPATDSHPRLYKTGDTACYHADGNLEFLGRKDNQVKIHGYRIELGEVESVLKRHPAIANAAVLLHKGNSGDLSLAAYVEAKSAERSSIMRVKEARDESVKLQSMSFDSLEQQGQPLEKERFLPVWNTMTELYISAAAKALEELGFFENFYATTEDFIRASNVSPRYNRWVDRAVEALQARALVKKDAKGVWQLIGQAPDLEACFALCNKDASELGYSAQEMELLSRTVHGLASILKEDVHSAEFYTLDSVPGFYQKIFGFSNHVAAALMTKIAAMNTGECKILEVGAGYGTVTEHLLPALAKEDAVRYTFTDVSQFFLSQAEEKFADYPFVDYRLFDLNVAPQLLGYAPHSYDIIFAGNVLHDVEDIRETLHNLASLLKPSGVLIMQEETEFQLPFDLTMGLQQGFDSAKDEEFRQKQPLLTRDMWRVALTENGLTEPQFFLPTTSLESELGLDIIACQGPAAVELFTPKTLQEYLQEVLPSWMIPNGWTLLDKMPLTPNGKVDRKRLAQSDTAPSTLANVAARTETEKRVADIWKGILKLDNVGVTESFFLVGGDSLTAFQLLRRMQDAFDCQLSLQELLQSPTVAAQALLVESKGSGESGNNLVTLRAKAATGSDVPSICMIHPIEGLVTSYIPLSEKMPESPFYAWQSAGLDGGDIHTDFETMVVEAQDALLQLEGPIILGGWSMGAFIAWEIARRIEKQGMGDKIISLLLIDPPAKNAWDALYDAQMDDMSSLLKLVVADPEKALAELTIQKDDFANLSEAEQALALAEAMQRSGQLAVDKDDLSFAGRIMEIIVANLKALRSYEPQSLPPMPVLYVHGVQQNDNGVRVNYWRSLSEQGFEELAVDADHWSLLKEVKNVDIIADAVQKILNKNI